MIRTLKFHRHYFLFTTLLLVLEICIALFIHDKWIRPYVGDVLVVMLIYCFIKSFFDVRVIPTAIGELLFAFSIETLQYFHVVHLLGLEQIRVARIVIGTSFSWLDLCAYTVGILLVIMVEKWRGSILN